MEHTHAVHPAFLAGLGWAAAGVLVGLVTGTLAAEVPEEMAATGAGADGGMRWSHGTLGILQAAALVLAVAAFAALALLRRGRPSAVLWLAAAVAAVPPFLWMGP